MLVRRLVEKYFVLTVKCQYLFHEEIKRRLCSGTMILCFLRGCIK